MVTLRKIDTDYWDIISLCVSKDQEHLVLNNAISIAQSKVQDECMPRGIYHGKTPVGFIMYCIDRDDDEYWLYKLMVDPDTTPPNQTEQVLTRLFACLSYLSNQNPCRFFLKPIHTGTFDSVFTYHCIVFFYSVAYDRHVNANKGLLSWQIK